MNSLITIGVGALVVLVVLVVVFKSMWRVAEPNEALIISGLRHHQEDASTESLGFRIVTGKGTLVVPGVQAVRRLSLDLREAELALECVTKQGIPVSLRGVVIFKVGDDYASIANAARRFLDQQQQMEARVHNVFAGHLRSIVGQLTVEEMIGDRERLTQTTRTSSSSEMEKLGLIIDSLQIQEIDDPTGYIKNLALPHTVAVEKQARIAKADAEREATQREQEANVLKAEAERTAQIKQAQYQSEIDQAKARTEQAGPLAQAAARQEVVVQETKVAELEAARREQQLEVEVRKPADAQAYQQRTLAQAERDSRISAAEAAAKETELSAAAKAQATQVNATAEAESIRARGAAEADAARARGEAEGAAARAKGLAEAEAIKARSEALAENQDAVIAQQLAESWPAIVAAGAGAFNNVDNMTVLNGAEGVTSAVTSLIGQSAAALPLIRQALAGPKEKAEKTQPTPVQPTPVQPIQITE